MARHRFKLIQRASLRTLGAGLLAALLLSGCGGGGGSSRSTPPATPPPSSNPPPPAVPSSAEVAAAALLSSQSTFGQTYDELVAAAQSGPAQWLDDQFALPSSSHKALLDELIAARNNGAYAEITEDLEFLILSRRLVWWHRAFTAPDVLRQRIAYALSQIFVVSDNVDDLIVNPYGLATYYDVLLDGAFGNYRDLLKNIALHPAMGIYLSHVNNRKADPANNTFPDENFAREVMQLFSIGLFELNNDGSLRRDNAGDPIPTYGNTEIREFAKIFTGLSYAGGSFGNPEPEFLEPILRNAIDAQGVFVDALRSATPLAATFSPGPFSAALRQIARVISARESLGACRQTFFVQVGGWDHHDEVLEKQAEMLPAISQGLTEFHAALTEMGMLDAVTTFTTSDFARTLTSNGKGSDHGWGGHHLVMGGAVNGAQIVGDYPTLSANSPLDTGRGVYAPTTAVDEYFAELALWLGVSTGDLDQVLPNVRNFYSPESGVPPLNFMS